MKNIAIILASGTGSRSGLDIPKQFYKINDKTLLEMSIEAFEINSNISSIIVVSNPDFIDLTNELSKKYSKVTKIMSGGKTRQESSFIAVNSINDTDVNVLIHDAVRPFVTQKIINDCINALEKYNAINVAIESSDTILEIDENNFIKNVPNRKFLRRVQTPQCFKLDIIKKAHEFANNDSNFQPTDDCGMVLKYNISPIYVVNGDEKNIKITYPSDIVIAKELI
jgi:2-C-methyl-D-erythritol 4-phosphate cytidylyltransferase